MNIEDVIGQEYELQGAGRYLRSVQHNSLIIDTETQRFYWNSKHINGNILDWYIKIKNIDYLTAKKICETNGLSIPDYTITHPKETIDVQADQSLMELFYKHGKNYLDYWTEYRGYNSTTIQRFKLGYSGQYYTIPLIEDGRFVNFQCRQNNPKRVKHWYKGIAPHSFNFSILPISKWVIITEGPVDAIMLMQHKLPAISQSGGAGNTKTFINNFSKFSHLDKVYIVYDNDEAGNIGAVKLAKTLGNKAFIYNFWDFSQSFDITDFFKSGKGADDFMEILDKKSIQKENMPPKRLGKYAPRSYL